MKKNYIFLIVVLAFLASLSAYFLFYNKKFLNKKNYKYPETDFGIFLDIQHAMNINDYKTASELSKKELKNYKINNIQILSSFMNGELVSIKDKGKLDSSIVAEFIKDAESIKNNDWLSVYKKHYKDNVVLMAPFKIWSSIAVGKQDEAIRFILKMKTSSSLKNFLLGQIYPEKGNIK